MDSYISDLCKEYRKQEIMTLAEELELSKRGSAGTIMEKVIWDLEDKGVPDESECSELMSDFLLASGFVDEDGNIIEDDEDEEEELDDEPLVIEKNPECFAFADDRDPACNKCKFKESCMVARINDRPECFGELFDRNSEECQGCLEVTFCKKE